MFYNQIKNLIMKKVFVFSLAFLFSICLVFGQVEKKEKELIKETKKELKEGSGDVKSERKQLKAEERELRSLEGDDVSNMSKQSFYADFGDVPNVKWNRVELYDEATFMKDGKEMKAFYDFDSKLVGTTQNVTFADLPENAQKEIKKEYKDYEIGSVVFFDNNEVNEGLVLLYGVQFESQDNYFVEMTKGTKKFILQVIDSGEVFFYEDIK